MPLKLSHGASPRKLAERSHRVAGIGRSHQTPPEKLQLKSANQPILSAIHSNERAARSPCLSSHRKAPCEPEPNPKSRFLQGNSRSWRQLNQMKRPLHWRKTFWKAWTILGQSCQRSCREPKTKTQVKTSGMGKFFQRNCAWKPKKSLFCLRFCKLVHRDLILYSPHLAKCDLKIRAMTMCQNVSIVWKSTLWSLWLSTSTPRSRPCQAGVQLSDGAILWFRRDQLRSRHLKHRTRGNSI